MLAGGQDKLGPQAQTANKPDVLSRSGRRDRRKKDQKLASQANEAEGTSSQRKSIEAPKKIPKIPPGQTVHNNRQPLAKETPAGGQTAGKIRARQPMPKGLNRSKKGSSFFMRDNAEEVLVQECTERMTLIVGTTHISSMIFSCKGLRCSCFIDLCNDDMGRQSQWSSTRLHQTTSHICVM